MIKYKSLNVEVGVSWPGWISVSERLPKRGVRVIGYDEFYGRIGEAHVAERAKTNHHLVFIDSDHCNITHWMPLPEAPQ